MSSSWTQTRIASAVTLSLAIILSLVGVFTQILPFEKVSLIVAAVLLAGVLTSLFWHREHGEAIGELRRETAALAGSVGQTRLIESTEEYYKRLASAIASATNYVDLLYLTKQPPSVLGPGSASHATAYWESFVRLAPTSRARFRRVASLDSAAKRDWVLTGAAQLERVTNYALRCYLPNAIGTLPLVAVEIIDKREVFLFGPHEHGVRLHIRNQAFAEAMSAYYESIWTAVGTGYELKALDHPGLNQNAVSAVRGLQF